MTVSDSSDRQGWQRRDWRLFRRLFHGLLHLPAPLLLFAARSLPTVEGVAPLDPRARFHAWFLRRFRRPTAPDPVSQRRAALLSIALLEGCADAGVAVEDRQITGPGGTLALRLYRPTQPAVEEATLPALIFLHFGGCVLGDLETCHVACTILAKQADCLVISVEYRLAPEHRHPAALEDTLAAWRWLCREARGLGVDPLRLAIGGDSAGGYLAAAASLALREAGEPLPALQVLIYPVLDMDRRAMPVTPFDASYPLSRDDMIWFSDHFLRQPSDAADPLCSIRRAPALAGVPPTLMALAGHDLLRAEGLAFADRLVREGVTVEMLDYPTLPHAFTAMSGGIPAAREALVEIARTAGRLLRTGQAPATP